MAVAAVMATAAWAAWAGWAAWECKLPAYDKTEDLQSMQRLPFFLAETYLKIARARERLFGRSPSIVALRAKRTTLLPHHLALRYAPEGRGQHAARALGDRWDEGDIGRQIRASILTAVGQRVSDDYDAEATTSDSTSARCRIQKSLDIANGLPSTRARAVDSHGRIVLCTHST